MERADEPEQEGDALNKTNLLKDETAALFGLSDEAVPDEALVSVTLLTGAGEPTETTPGAIGQCYFDTDAEVFYKCVLHIVDGDTTTYTWAKMGSGNEGAFGTRGPVIITTTQTLDLSQYGLKVGDKVNVICIGGGGGGASGSGSGYGAGGNGGKPGKAYGSTSATSPPGGGGAGGGYGAGGGGGAGCGGNYAGGGGGGGGYLSAKTIVLESTSVAITIGAAGKGNSPSGFETVAGGNGGTTSFGSLLSAAGGAGGKGGTSVYGSAGGVSATTGGAGGDRYYSSSASKGGGGGGGGGGWLIENFTAHTCSNGEDGADGASGVAGRGGAGGSNGGAGGNGTDQNGDGFPASGGTGTGVVIFWY